MKNMPHYDDMNEKKILATQWFSTLRDNICDAIEEIERSSGSSSSFVKKPWQRPGGGGGVMSVLKGKVFEKVGVNISTVTGAFSPEFAKSIPGSGEKGEFFAAGISLVAHMSSPLVPAVHMNTRFIVTEKAWFGGGVDLTPSILFDEDTNHFHQTLKAACDKVDQSYYPKFKAGCDDYFYLPHRNEHRGVGGIFYDYVNTGDWDKDFSLTQNVGAAFLESFIPIVKRRMYMPWGVTEKNLQLLKRGRYVEFNLLYDRGTKFGLMTEGNIDAIFMSMPPEVKWE